MKKLVIGVDIGGINTVLGLVDRTGEVYARSSFRTAEYPFFDDYPAYVEMLVRTLRELCAAMPAGAVLSGIGIGAPNANYHTGRIERPVNLWKFRSGEPNPEEGRRFFSLCKEVGNSFPGIPVRITNDANAAALGEIAYGNAGGMRDFIMVTLGTGLGSGFVAGGRMIYGHDGMAGELGHVVVEPRRTAMRLRTPWLSGNLCFCDGCQTDGLRVDGPGNGAERFTRCTLRQVRRPDNYRSGAKG